jgi:hypothetical protein
MTPCSPLKVSRRFGGTYHLHLQGLRNKFSKKPASKQVAALPSACHRGENHKSNISEFIYEVSFHVTNHTLADWLRYGWWFAKDVGGPYINITGPRTTTAYLSPDIRYPDRDSNQRPYGHKTRVLPLLIT